MFSHMLIYYNKLHVIRIKSENCPTLSISYSYCQNGTTLHINAKLL